MSYLVLARKYRPQLFEQVVEQAHVTRTLSNAIATGRLAHAVLFAGPRGTGKTTVARILAKAMNCEQGPAPEPCNQCRSCREITEGNAADVFEIDGASNNSVDQVRELRENLKYMPVHSRYKIYIIDEVHMLSLAAFNALLKTLEEPPDHILFMFATTEVQKIPITILSRCQRHDFRRIIASAIASQMNHICHMEKVDVDKESLDLIAREAGGSMRDGLSLLDHVLACAQGPVTADLISDLLCVVDRRHLFAFSKAVLTQDIHSVLDNIDGVWRQGYEIKRFYADLVAHFHHLAIVKLADQADRLVDLPVHEVEMLRQQIVDIPESRLVQIFDLLFQAEPSIRFTTQPKLALEMLFLKLFQTPPTLPIDKLIDHLDQLSGRLAVEGLKQSDACISGQASNAVPSSPPAGKSPGAGENVAVDNEEGPLSLNMEELWSGLTERLGAEKPGLAALLKKCRPQSFDSGCLQVEVQGNEFTLRSITRQASLLEAICGELGQRPVRLDLVANVEDGSQKRKQKKKTDRLKRKALDHPMVMEVLELFDGKVVDVKIP